MTTLRCSRSRLFNQRRIENPDLATASDMLPLSAQYVQPVFDSNNASRPGSHGQQNHNAFPQRLLERVNPAEEQDAADHGQRKCPGNRPRHTAGAAKQRVVPPFAVQLVVAIAAVQAVRAVAAMQDIVAIAAEQAVVALPGKVRIVAPERIVAGTAFEMAAALYESNGRRYKSDLRRID